MTRQGIFISYRRADSADVVGRMYDRLSDRFGADHVFKDVDSIRLGANFKQTIDERIDACRVLIAVIGPDWLDARDETGQRRLDDPRDFVRSEIEAALAAEIPVIPVLVRGAVMPAEADLPESIRELALRHGMPLRADPDFRNDIERLIDGIGPVEDKPQPASPPPPAPTPAKPPSTPHATPPLDLNESTDTSAPPPPEPTDAPAPPPLPLDDEGAATPDTHDHPLARWVPDPAKRLMICVPAALAIGLFGGLLLWASLDILFVDETFVRGTIYDPAHNQPDYPPHYDGFAPPPTAPGFNDPAFNDPAFNDPGAYDDSGDLEYVLTGLVGIALVGVSALLGFFAYLDIRLLQQRRGST